MILAASGSLHDYLRFLPLQVKECPNSQLMTHQGINYHATDILRFFNKLRCPIMSVSSRYCYDLLIVVTAEKTIL
jgi:hypothetical protein